MKNTMKTKFAAVTMSTLMIASTITALSALSASAATETVKGDGEATKIVSMVNQEANPVVEKTTKLNAPAKAYYFKATGKTDKGYDWTYKTDKDIVQVKCKYDFNEHKYTFKLTGTAKGKANFTLMYKKTQTKWVKVPMKITVDAQKNIIRTA